MLHYITLLYANVSSFSEDFRLKLAHNNDESDLDKPCSMRPPSSLSVRLGQSMD